MTKLIVICNKCNHQHIIDKDEFGIEIVYKDFGRENGNGSTFIHHGEYSSSCDFENCVNNIDIEVDFFEHPEGMLDNYQFNIKGGNIEQEFEIDVSMK